MQHVAAGKREILWEFMLTLSEKCATIFFAQCVEYHTSPVPGEAGRTGKAKFYGTPLTEKQDMADSRFSYRYAGVAQLVEQLIRNQ